MPKLCALFGRELRGEPFASIWDADCAGASAHCGEEPNADFEMLLLPLIHRGRFGTRLIGVLAPLTQPFWLGMWPAKPLRLGTIEYIAPDAGPTSLAGLNAQRPAVTRLTVIDGGRP